MICCFLSQVSELQEELAKAVATKRVSGGVSHDARNAKYILEQELQKEKDAHAALRAKYEAQCLKYILVKLMITLHDLILFYLVNARINRSFF